METFLRNLENQVEQLASNLSKRPQGGLPSNTENNPREEVNAITLRNGRELEKVEKEPRKVVDKGKRMWKKPQKKMILSHLNQHQRYHSLLDLNNIF